MNEWSWWGVEGTSKQLRGDFCAVFTEPMCGVDGTTVRRRIDHCGIYLLFFFSFIYQSEQCAAAALDRTHLRYLREHYAQYFCLIVDQCAVSSRRSRREHNAWSFRPPLHDWAEPLWEDHLAWYLSFLIFHFYHRLSMSLTRNQPKNLRRQEISFSEKFEESKFVFFKIGSWRR